MGVGGSNWVWTNGGDVATSFGGVASGRISASNDLVIMGNALETSRPLTTGLKGCLARVIVARRGILACLYQYFGFTSCHFDERTPGTEKGRKLWLCIGLIGVKHKRENDILVREGFVMRDDRGGALLDTVVYSFVEKGFEECVSGKLRKKIKPILQKTHLTDTPNLNHPIAISNDRSPTQCPRSLLSRIHAIAPHAHSFPHAASFALFPASPHFASASPPHLAANAAAVDSAPDPRDRAPAGDAAVAHPRPLPTPDPPTAPHSPQSAAASRCHHRMIRELQRNDDLWLLAPPGYGCIDEQCMDGNLYITFLHHEHDDLSSGVKAGRDLNVVTELGV
uniref:Uncharacterized protein n=1 Tax=Oryza rufipogon TaxID=4529 RepID=A0A0E0Q432_ORYRU